MPKLKTVKSVKHRIKVTGTGKLMVFRAGRRHLLSKKRSKRKRKLRNPRLLAPAEVARLRNLIQYS